MPIIQSAKKADRAARKKYLYNQRRREAMKRRVKGVRDAVAQKDTASARQQLPEAYKAIDKALKRGVIKENTAARKKSRLTRSIEKLEA